MKKLKFLPSILMLTLCIAILGVGVFAVAPTQNTISGSITINSANPEVRITVFGHKADGSLDENNVIMEETPARSGININLKTLEFDTSSCNTEEDLAKLDIKITIRVSNPSSSNLGVYFSNKEINGQTTSDDDVTTEMQLTDSTTSKTNVKVVMDGYKSLNAKGTNNGVCETTIIFKLLSFMDSNASVDLSAEVNKMYLNIEPLNQQLVPKDDAYYANLGYTIVGAGRTTLTSEDTAGTSGKIKIADGVTTIGDSAFFGNSAITEVIIPEGVISIENDAFNQANLERVELPSSLKSIGDNAFEGNGNLVSIEIPDEVISIGGYAFYECYKLNSIIIPSSVTSIGGDAFTFCNSLNTITIKAGTATTFACTLPLSYDDTGYTLNGTTACTSSTNITRVAEYDNVYIKN